MELLHPRHGLRCPAQGGHSSLRRQSCPSPGLGGEIAENPACRRAGSRQARAFPRRHALPDCCSLVWRQVRKELRVLGWKCLLQGRRGPSAQEHALYSERVHDIYASPHPHGGASVISFSSDLLCRGSVIIALPEGGRISRFFGSLMTPMGPPPAQGSSGLLADM